MRNAQDLIARAQQLCDTPRPAGGYSVAWYAEALSVGDLTAIAVADLRERLGSSSGLDR